MNINPKVQLTQNTIHRPHEGQEEGRPHVDTSILLRRGIKIPIGGNLETKGRVVTKGKAIQRLLHIGIHPYTVTKPVTIVDANKH